jgi:DNA (cytosine-5)-methyltransferase 3A
MNVLSLFDGMSCGQIALQKSGIQVDNYFASEIDKYAIKVAKANYPDTVHLGDVRDVKADDLPQIDLLIGGSPCQGFSFAGKQLNFDDPRSKLFWEFVRLLKDLRPKYFLLENVKMKQQSMDVITEALGVEPTLINSGLVSAQNRPRYYWTNIPMDGLPDDKGIVMRDIIETEPVDAHYEAGKHLIKGYKGGNQLNPTYKSQANTIHPLDGKVGTLCAGTHGYSNGYVPTRNGLILAGHASDIRGFDVVRRVYHPDGKAPTLTTMQGGHRQPKVSLSDTTWRKLTPLECERLQTVPEGYTNHVSNTQRYKMLGNGWTVDVISHIFNGMKETSNA